MACMFHICQECDHQWEDNIRGGHCPECKSPLVQHTFDEESIGAEAGEEEGEVEAGWE